MHLIYWMTHCVTSSNKTRKGDGVIRSLTALPNQYITGLKKKKKNTTARWGSNPCTDMVINSYSYSYSYCYYYYYYCCVWFAAGLRLSCVWVASYQDVASGFASGLHLVCVFVEKRRKICVFVEKRRKICVSDVPKRNKDAILRLRRTQAQIKRTQTHSCY